MTVNILLLHFKKQDQLNMNLCKKNETTVKESCKLSNLYQEVFPQWRHAPGIHKTKVSFNATL